MLPRAEACNGAGSACHPAYIRVIPRSAHLTERTSKLFCEQLRLLRRPRPPRYGARNAVSAASISSGASSATQWPAPGMTTLCTSSASELHRVADVLTVAFRSADRQDGHRQPPVLRCSFCAMVASSAR